MGNTNHTFRMRRKRLSCNLMRGVSALLQINFFHSGAARRRRVAEIAVPRRDLTNSMASNCMQQFAMPVATVRVKRPECHGFLTQICNDISCHH